MERILLVAAWVVAAQATAQQDDSQRPLRQALATIEVNARTIRDRDVDLGAMQTLLYVITAQVYQLPALTVDQPLAQPIESRIQEDLASLQADVASSDTAAARRHATDLVTHVAELRSTMGLSP